MVADSSPLYHSFDSSKTDLAMSSQSIDVRNAKILIVEDEVLIADTIKMNLERHGYQVAATAISYEEAVEAIEKHEPDAVLLDIRLNGPRSGVDVARYLRAKSSPPPFIFLTSQMDDFFLEQAKQTHPVAYLGKPIQINSLLATLKMVTHNTKAYQRPERTIEIRHKGINKVVRLNDICYLESEHVYIRIVLVDGHDLLVRGRLQDMMTKLDSDRFLQVHRSFIVNFNRVTGHDNTSLYFGEVRIPVSRSRRREILDLLR